MRILCLSNGHGEDHIACRIALELRLQGYALEALPIVGQGHAYHKAAIPVIVPVRTLPSGGFVYMDWRQLWRDWQAGLGGLLWQQMQALKQWRRQYPDGLILATGDIVVQLLAAWSGAHYVYVGTAKTDYYQRDEQGCHSRRWFWQDPVPSDYLPWERWLMRSRRCRAVFARDQLTAKNLERWAIPVYDLGNPMLDGLAAQDTVPELDPQRPALLLLPGSRAPEAYHNWQLMQQVCQYLPSELQLYAALSTGIDPPEWQQTPVVLVRDRFGSCLHRATVVLAMAGTATEQCVGLAKPVVTFPGAGPQFTARFAEAQSRHLGESIFYQPHSDPEAIAARIVSLVQSPPDLRFNASRRMGHPGAAARIATCISSLFIS